MALKLPRPKKRSLKAMREHNINQEMQQAKNGETLPFLQ